MNFDRDDKGIADQLVDAIHQKRLFETCAALQEHARVAEDDKSQRMVEQALATCRTISREVAETQTRLLAALAASGVKATASPPVTETSGLQYHDFRIELAQTQLVRVLQVMSAQGFAVDTHLRVRWKAVQAAARSLYLMAWDQNSTRVMLTWNTPIKSPLRKLEPNPADFALAPIPAFLWPLYFAVKPARFLVERITRQRTADRLGLKSGSFSLGTPPALFDGLFDLAEITQNDTLVDLGCGDGRVVIEAAKRFGCKAIGVERNASLVTEARQCIAEAGLEALVEIHHGPVEDFNISNATVVFLFLPRELVNAILDRIFVQGRKNTRVVAHEQHPLVTTRPADKAVPIFAENALTVGSLWTVN